MELNPQQRAAVEQSGRHVLVLAGAGTGKTRTIAARALHLIRSDGVDPRRILLLTFTRRAAREMTSRLSRDGDLGPLADSIPAGTFHHFCLRCIRRLPKQFGAEGFTVIDADDQLQLMRLARAGVRRKKEVFPRAREILQKLSYARNTNLGFRDYLDRYTEGYDEELIDRLCRCASDYSARKRDGGYMDFDDLLHLVARKLHGDRAARDRIRDLYDHVLVDEMQDTNPLQWLILDALRDPALLFCVGDDAQSIYAFRGADFRNVHSFTERVPGAVVLRLQENYRSTQETLDLSNWLLSGSELSYEKDLRAFRGPGIRPKLVECEDEVAEAAWIVDDVIERHEAGSAWEDHMIIARSAWASRSVEAEMVRREVPYIFVGGTRLLSAAHVKDLLCTIRAAGSERDHIAWIRYLTLWPRVGDVGASRVIEVLDGGGSLEEALGLLRVDDSLRARIAAGISSTRESWGSPSGAIRAATEFLTPVLQERYPGWEGRRRDLDLLAHLAEGFRSMVSFLETYALDPVYTTEARRRENDDAVTLITAHSAKGTECPVCYLVRVEPGFYPHIRSVGSADDEEEERRVLYVAMTRAADELIITRSCSRFGRRVFFGGSSAPGTGYFLKDLPGELVDSIRTGFDREDDEGLSSIVPWKSGQ